MTEQATVPVTLREMKIDEFRGKGAGLIQEHYSEVAQDKRYLLDPDWVAYHSMEARELALCVGAFVGEEFVGYSLNFLMPSHLHYKYPFAQNDIFFVTKAHRGEVGDSKLTIGDMLRAETKAIAKKRGSHKVFWHAKKGTAMDAWLKRKGLKVADIIYVEDL